LIWIYINYRGYLQYLQLPVTGLNQIYDDHELHYDIEWLAIVTTTHDELRKARFIYKNLPKAIPTEVMIIIILIVIF
jgi:hypothetical protein